MNAQRDREVLDAPHARMVYPVKEHQHPHPYLARRRIVLLWPEEPQLPHAPGDEVGAGTLVDHKGMGQW